jgi:hypothetical protein
MVTGAVVLAFANTPLTNFSAPKKTNNSNAAYILIITQKTLL